MSTACFSGRLAGIFWAFFLSLLSAQAAKDSTGFWQAKARRLLLDQPGLAAEAGEKALSLSKNSGDARGKVQSHEIVAEALIRRFLPDKAFSHLFEALEISSREKLLSAKVRCLMQIGRLNWILEDGSKAAYYFSEAVKEGRKAGDFRLQLLAEAYSSYLRIQLNPPGEEADYLKVRELHNFVSVAPIDTSLLAQASNLMGNVAFLQKTDIDLAIRYYQQAIDYANQMGDSYLEASYAQNYAEMLIKKGNILAAEEVLARSLKTARLVNSDMLVFSNLKLLASCAALRLDFKRAYEYQSAYEDLKSRQLNETQHRRTDEILQEYMRRKKEMQIRDKEIARAAANLASEKKLRYYQNFILASLFAFILLAAWIISNRTQIKRIRKQRELVEKQNHELEILNEKLRIQSLESEKSKELAESALRARADFLSVITHELRTPIHAVIAAAHLLENADNSLHSRQNLEILRFSAENLYGLINNVLDFNKIESGKIELEPKPFSLRELLEGIQMTFLPRAEEKGLELIFRVDRQLPDAFLGDRLRLGQVLSNLLSNAIKFTHKGRVGFEIQYNRGDSEGNLSISIRDTGIGMNKEKSERVFGFFSQANPGISGRYGGSGLGITITSRLLELMDCKLLIESEQGKGSHFYFKLHLPETDALFLERSRPGTAEASFSRFRILFVEDVQFNRILAQRFFDKWLVAYDFAASGQEALQLAELHRYDLILMDIRLPDMSGFEVASKIRAIPGTAAMPILAMTASDRNEVEEEIQQSGMQGFLGKPFSPQDLRMALQAWLGVQVKS
jgi:signal transduction histidine kinase/ActR/RegA family two-component response regulator